MADTTALKNRIRAAIKANDNQEITGPVLQQALLDIVDELNGATEKNIDDGSVTMKKLSFIEYFNLIDNSEGSLHTRSYVDSSVGTEYRYGYPNDLYDATEAIILEQGITYIYSGSSARFIAYFDANNIVTRLIKDDSQNHLIQLQQGEVGVIITFYATSDKKYQLEKGTTATPYQEHKPIIPESCLGLYEIKENIDAIQANSNAIQASISTQTFTNNITSLNQYRVLIANNILIKEGEQFILRLEGTAVAQRFIILGNTPNDNITNRVLDSPTLNKDYIITAREDINSLYLWGVYGYTELGYINTIFTGGLRAEVEIIKNDLRELEFINDIAIPNTLYMLSKMTVDDRVISQNDIFYKEILKRWMPYDSYIVLSGLTFSKKWSNVASVEEPTEGSHLTTTLRNYKSMSVIKSKNSTIHVGEPGVGNSDVYVMVMGDSTVNGSCHRALYSYGFVPNIHCVGLRKTTAGQYDEGRGGWTLNAYGSISNSPVFSYNPFWQPQGNYIYLGSTGFWINAWLCKRGTQPSGFEPTYSCSRFNDYVGLFDENTGYFLNPQNGYIMYDNTQKKYMVYSNGSWNETTTEAYTWGYSFKYLSVFNIHVPDYFVMSLGLNDFRDNLTPDFASWNAKVNSLIAAFLEVNPNGYFIISTCTVSTGKMDNVGNDTNFQHAAMWQAKQNIIDNFSNLENEHVYIVDTALMVDADHAFSNTDKPVGHPLNTNIVATQNIQSGNPHFYDGYNAWGIPLAAFIQYTRTDT